MGLGLLLIPSLAGYWFLQHANITRFGNYRLSGYHLLFRSALSGIVLIALSHPIAVLINSLEPSIRSFLYAHVPIDYVDTVILTILLAVAAPPVINRIYSEERAAKRAAETNGDLIEMVIADAFERLNPIELSLKNRKSYVGLDVYEMFQQSRRGSQGA